jgi:hypothetical protein
MWKRRRIWFALIALAGVALAVYFEPTHCVRGWLRGEAFFDGRPTSYWAEELERWQVDYGGCEAGGCSAHYARRSVFPPWIERILPKRESEWPALLDGDPEAMPVLEELRSHPSHHVRYLADAGIDRTHTSERGPWFFWSIPDE